jgi:radical SAM protein with 4Fe4S-binding SPASM domain
MIELFDIYWEDTEHPITIGTLQDYINIIIYESMKDKKYLRRPSQECQFSDFCGNHLLFAFPNGDLFVCDHREPDPDFIIGSINDFGGDLAKIFENSETIKRLKKRSATMKRKGKMPFSDLNNAGCPANAKLYFGSYENQTDPFKSSYTKIGKHVKKRLREAGCLSNLLKTQF